MEIKELMPVGCVWPIDPHTEWRRFRILYNTDDPAQDPRRDLLERYPMRSPHPFNPELKLCSVTITKHTHCYYEVRVKYNRSPDYSLSFTVKRFPQTVKIPRGALIEDEPRSWLGRLVYNDRGDDVRFFNWS